MTQEELDKIVEQHQHWINVQRGVCERFPLLQDSKGSGGVQMSERKYFVLSLKHLFPWKLGQPLCLCGHKRTADNEPRCFGGYNTKPSTSELYTIEEYLEKYGKYNAVRK